MSNADTTYLYDGSFEGFLTVVFEAYERKQFPLRIHTEALFVPDLYQEVIPVITDEAKAARVWNGLIKKISKEARYQMWVVFLSEAPNIEMLLFSYMQKAFASAKSIETNFADDSVLEAAKLYRKVSREAERMRMFVRFKKSADGIFFSMVEPIYNVLPLIPVHFEDRFADQEWVIYDLRRRYGLYYNLHKTTEIQIANPIFDQVDGSIQDEFLAEEEKLFQKMWKNYYKALTIKERLNPRLHVQNLPRRFWKFLPEKE